MDVLNSEKKHKEKKLTIVAVIFASVLGYSSLVLLPLFTEAIIQQYGFSKSITGFILAVQLICAAAMSFVVSARVQRLNLTTTAVVGGFLMILANSIALFLETGEALIVSRIVLGLGEGALVASLNAIISRTKNPIYLFSIAEVASAVSAMVFYITVPYLMLNLGPGSIFGFIIGLALLSLPLLKRLPNLDVPTIYQRQETKIKSLSNFTASKRASVYILLVLFVSFAGGQGVWTYLVQIGSDIGVSAETVGQCLAVGALLSLFGPLLAQRISTTFGNAYAMHSINLSLVLIVICVLATTNTTSSLIYWLAVLPKQFLTLFMFTLVMGLLASLDPQGKAAAAAGAYINLGTAIAPGISGVILFYGDYVLMGWASSILILISIFLIFHVEKLMRNAFKNSIEVAI